MDYPILFTFLLLDMLKYLEFTKYIILLYQDCDILVVTGFKHVCSPTWQCTLQGPLCSQLPPHVLVVVATRHPAVHLKVLLVPLVEVHHPEGLDVPASFLVLMAQPHLDQLAHVTNVNLKE